MWAFDLIELDGDDLRGDPLAVRKATLERVIAQAMPGIRFNEHLDHEDGSLVFHHACKLGLEGIVSKRRDSVYSSGPSPEAPAVSRPLASGWSGRWNSSPSCAVGIMLHPDLEAPVARMEQEFLALADSEECLHGAHASQSASQSQLANRLC
jgi:hypothetical protein